MVDDVDIAIHATPLRIAAIVVVSLVVVSCATAGDLRTSTYDASVPMVDGSNLGDLSNEVTGSGGASTGGSFDFGNSAASGGALVTDGTGGTSGTTDCGAGQKRCGGICVLPAPGIGCSLSGCEPCGAAPNNATAVCRDGACSFQCDSGYVLAGSECLLEASGGGSGGVAATGGTGGFAGTGGVTNTGGTRSSGGTSGGSSRSSACDVLSCPGCSVVGPFPCCRSNDTCGCTWAPGAYCL